MATSGNKYLSVYYFKGQDHWCRPQSIRDDMKRFVDAGVDAIDVAIHESSLEGDNLPVVCEEAARAGLEVWGVPSRVGGLVAGWSRAVGYLSAWRPDLYARDADGSPAHCYGPQISVHHPGSVDAFTEVVQKMQRQFRVNGLIWDEVKSFHTVDHGPAAVERVGGPSSGRVQAEATVRFFSEVNRRLKAVTPDVRIAMFLYADMSEEVIRLGAATEGLDEFGCDGRCLRPEDPQRAEGGGEKVLLGGRFQRFRDAAHANGRRSFVLIETQTQPRAALELTLERLGELLVLGPEHVVYYDYPRHMEDAEWMMPRLAAAMRSWRRGG